MLYLHITSTDPYENLALEEYLLRRSPTEKSIFLLWQNTDTVVVGRYQNTSEEVDTVYAAHEGIQISRRMTGGGAVYHDMGNVNFSFIGPCTHPDTLDFTSFSNQMVQGLKSMGIKAEISGRNDLIVNGRKCSGSAQTVLGGNVLHHGTLLFSTNLGRMSRVLTVSQEKLRSKGVASVCSRVTNLCEHTALNIQEFQNRLLSYFGTQPLELNVQDCAEIKALRAEKYTKHHWIFGQSPGYTIRKKRRFSSGLVDVLLDVGKGNCIQSISFQGDFFSSGDIHALEHLLCGTQMMEDDLRKALAGLTVERYITGVDADMLIALLLT